VLTIVCKEGERLTCVDDSTALPALLADRSRLFWLDLQSPTDGEFALLSSVFHFHPIAVEDAMRPHQRPKVDEYDGYFFLTADEVTLNANPFGKSTPGEPDREDVQSRQMSMFLGPNYLVTVQINPIEALRNLRERCEPIIVCWSKGPIICFTPCLTYWWTAISRFSIRWMTLWMIWRIESSAGLNIVLSKQFSA
jgi:Mg2+ and Co2+ transporter CorA